TAVKRFSIVPELSSAARIPLPGATSALAVASSSFISRSPPFVRAVYPRPAARATPGCARAIGSGIRDLPHGRYVAVLMRFAEPRRGLRAEQHSRGRLREVSETKTP